GVPGGAARVRERALVELYQIGDAELGEPACEAVADDAAADDDHLHTVTSTRCIACSKSSTCARMSTAASSPLPRTIDERTSRCASTASSRSSARSSAIIQMRSAS